MKFTSTITRGNFTISTIYKFLQSPHIMSLPSFIELLELE